MARLGGGASIYFFGWQIDEDIIDVQPGDRLVLIALRVPSSRYEFSTASRPVQYVHDIYDTIYPGEVGGELVHVRIDGVVQSVEGASARPLAGTSHVDSTREAVRPRFTGAIVTMNDDADISDVVLTPDLPRFEQQR